MTQLAAVSGVIDSHAHIDFPDFADDREGVLTRMATAGVSDVVCIATDLAGYPRQRALAESASNIWFTSGIHPNSVKAFATKAERAALLTNAKHPRCVAIGEAGLDYFRNPDYASQQESVFSMQLEVAKAAGLPIVVHARDADEMMQAMLTEAAKTGEISGVMHCFSSGAELAEKALEIGFYISFSGMLTFATAEPLRAIARAVPADRLLVETDAPYLSPAPLRKVKRNEPAHVVHTLACLAELKGESLQSMADITAANTRRLFWRMEAQ